MQAINTTRNLWALALVLLTVGGCARKTKKTHEMSFKELKEKTVASMNNKDEESAREYLEHLVIRHAQNQDVSTYKLLLADIYFKASRYAEAFELYKDFFELYPSDKNAEYSCYRCILSKYYQTLRADCDTSITEQTIKLCNFYLEEISRLKFRKDVNAIKLTCNQKMIDKEVYVYNFYLRQGKYKSAKNRLKYLRDNYLNVSADLEPRLLYLEGKLAKREKEHDVVKGKVASLIDKYPDSQFTHMARSLVTSDGGAFLF